MSKYTDTSAQLSTVKHASLMSLSPFSWTKQFFEHSSIPVTMARTQTLLSRSSRHLPPQAIEPGNGDRDRVCNDRSCVLDVESLNL